MSRRERIELINEKDYIVRLQIPIEYKVPMPLIRYVTRLLTSSEDVLCEGIRRTIGMRLVDMISRSKTDLDSGDIETHLIFPIEVKRETTTKSYKYSTTYQTVQKALLIDLFIGFNVDDDEYIFTGICQDIISTETYSSILTIVYSDNTKIQDNRKTISIAVRKRFGDELSTPSLVKSV